MFRMKYTIGVVVVVLILGIAFTLMHLTRPTSLNDDSYSTVILLPAHEWRPMLDEKEVPFASDDFMIIKQREDDRSINEPVTDVRASSLIEHNCGTLSVTINGHGAISLNTIDLGAVRDTSALKTKITDVFKERITQRAYLPGMERRTDLPEIKRIPRTVLLRPSRLVTVEDVIAVLQLLRELSAEPIALQIDHLPT